jgi:peptidyl-tRNA hydrolase, PTH2 family
MAYYYYADGSGRREKRKPRSAGISPENGEDESDEDESSIEDHQNLTGTACSEWGMMDVPYKMLLVVNMELSMGKGKIAAQCCHAAVGCFERATRACPKAVQAWKRTGCAKIAVKCPSAEELIQLQQVALAMDIPHYLVEDAGRTQIAAGSKTVLGLGPAPVHVFQGVTDHLKLM